MIGQGFCQEMRRGDEAEVNALLRAAYGQDSSAAQVAALRKRGEMAGEMVVPGPDGLIGYYALSWCQAPKGWLAVGPVAIAPEHQGRGQGRRMIGQLGAWAAASGQTVVAKSAPAFFLRCGFAPVEGAPELTLAGPGKWTGELRRATGWGDAP